MGYKGKPIYVTVNGVETLYDSVKQAAIALGMQPARMRYYTLYNLPVPGVESWRWKTSQDYTPCDNVDWSVVLGSIEHLARMASMTLAGKRYREVGEYFYDKLLDRALKMQYPWGMAKYLRSCIPWIRLEYLRERHHCKVSLDDEEMEGFDPVSEREGVLKDLPDHLVPVAEWLLKGKADLQIARKMHITVAKVQSLKEELGRWLKDRWQS